jgi:heat-inducible transcriptional repressor
MIDRTFYILKLVVEHFVKTAEPVGSQTLIDAYKLDISSATIRNEMQELENQGYLEKTHTSSGRVPSTKGYQYYIDNLRNKDKYDNEFKYQIANVLTERARTIEDVLTESCEILSHMTNLVSMVLGGSSTDECLANLQLVPISKNSATVIFVTDSGNVENKTFFFDEKLKLQDLKDCVEVLNKRLIGTKISELVERMKQLKPLLFDSLLDGDALYQTMLRSFIKLNDNRMIVFGKEKLLDQPEFTSNPESLKKLMDLLDSPQYFKDITTETKAKDGISVKIGNENSDLKDISVVSANLNLPGAEDKVISLVGPTRMNYDEAFAAIEVLLNELHKRFTPANDSRKESQENDK